MSVKSATFKAGMLMSQRTHSRNNKKVAMASHKFMILAGLMQETLDELEANSDSSKLFREDTERLSGFLEKFIEDLGQLKQVKSTTYIQNIMNKVDTIVRREYKVIEE